MKAKNQNAVSTAILLLIFVYFLSSFLFRCNAQIITVPEDDINTQFGVFVDPTLTDKGVQFGVFAVMVMNWGYVGASASTYPELGGVGYSDLVGELGLICHLFGFEPVRYYGGFRLGRIWREAGGGYNLAGGALGLTGGSPDATRTSTFTSGLKSGRIIEKTNKTARMETL